MGLEFVGSEISIYFHLFNPEPLKRGKKYHILGVFYWHGEPLKRGKNYHILTVQGNKETKNMTKIASQNVVKSTTF